MSLPLAQRYAQALYEICNENDEHDAVVSDMTDLAQLLKNSLELKDFVNNHALARSKQEVVLRALFNKKISDTTMVFLLFLVNKSRLHILPAICFAFENMVLASQNIVKAVITSSQELDERQIDSIKRHVGKSLNKEVREEVLIDPALVGGVKVRIGDEIYDYTLRAQLDEFRSQFNKVA